MPQLGKCGPGGGKCVGHSDAGHILCAFKLCDKGRNHTGQADAKPIFHGNNGRFLHAADTLHICAQAAGVQSGKIALDDLFPIVEVMVAERYKIIPAEV